MMPASAVSALVFAHPDSEYFAVGTIGKDQVSPQHARTIARLVPVTFPAILLKAASQTRVDLVSPTMATMLCFPLGHMSTRHTALCCLGLSRVAIVQYASHVCYFKLGITSTPPPSMRLLLSEGAGTKNG